MFRKKWIGFVEALRSGVLHNDNATQIELFEGIKEASNELTKSTRRLFTDIAEYPEALERSSSRKSLFESSVNDSIRIQVRSPFAHSL